MANVLLMVPPLTPKELFVRGSGSSASLIPPLGLAYIAAHLRRAGHRCRIIDGIADPQPVETLCEEAKRFDVIGMSVVSAYAIRAIELIGAIKASGCSAPIVVGGPHVTALPDSLLACGADVAVVGEGELTMCQLVEELATGRPNLPGVKGIAYRSGDRTVATGRRELIHPLDQLDLPARDLLPMDRYHTSIARSSHQPSHSMLASRGCPGLCTFCSRVTFGTRVRYFAPGRIVDEFFELRDRYGARDVAVWDDNFPADPEVAIETCDRLRSRGFDRSWSVEARVDCITREVLQALRDAGCTYIAYGFESGSQEILDRVRKHTTIEQMVGVVRMTKEAGIRIRGYFMLGLPGETADHVRRTIAFAKKLDVELASFTLFVPLPGSLDYRRAQQSGQFDPDYWKRQVLPEFNFLDRPIYVPDGMTESELLALHRSAYQQYYFRPKTLLRRIVSVRGLEDLMTMASGAKTLIANTLHRPDAAVKAG